MKSWDDFMKEFYKDDPKGYQEHLEHMEQVHKDIEEKDRLEREKVASLFLEPTRDGMFDLIETMSNKELSELIHRLKRVHEFAEEKYHENMDIHVFSKSKRTLKDISLLADWELVKKDLESFSPEELGEEVYGAYKEILNKLQNEITPAENEESLAIVLRHVTEDGADYHEVIGMKPKDMQSYALDFCPWSEWAGFYCSEEDIEKHGVSTFIAHVLWEMTFDGFDEEQIKEKADELKRRADVAKEEIEEDDD